MSKADRKALVVLHYEEAGDIPFVYINGDVEVLSVCDYAPDDRVYRMSKVCIPADLLDSIKEEPIGYEGDRSSPELRLKKLFAEVRGKAHLKLVEE